MINNTVVGSSKSSPVVVFTSTVSGAPRTTGNPGRERAVTTIILCNTGTPDPAGIDETINSAVVDVYLVSPDKGGLVNSSTKVISNLIIPAGETVFFSEERIVLDSGDEIRVGADYPNNSTGPGSITATVSSLLV